MCVIIYKPAGEKIPSKELLILAQRANPHGCGLCSPSVFYKGVSFSSFIQHINQCSEDEPLLIHFRLATHGSIKRSNCHPFYDRDTDLYFMHNGILNVTPSGDMTDSEFAFRRYFLPEISARGLLDPKVQRLINEVRGSSKFAFMQGDEVYLLGDFIEKDGLYFSNLRFEYYRGF